MRYLVILIIFCFSLPASAQWTTIKRARIDTIKFYDGTKQYTAGGGSGVETDPIVRAINGIIKSNGSTISAATAGTDYLTKSDTIGGTRDLLQTKSGASYSTSIDSIGTTNQNKTLSFLTYSYEKIRMTGNITLTLSALTATNLKTVYICLIQDGVGSRIVTWAGSVKFPGGVTPILSSSANAKDQLMFVWDGYYYVFTSVSYNNL